MIVYLEVDLEDLELLLDLIPDLADLADLILNRSLTYIKSMYKR